MNEQLKESLQQKYPKMNPQALDMLVQFLTNVGVDESSINYLKEQSADFFRWLEGISANKPAGTASTATFDAMTPAQKSLRDDAIKQFETLKISKKYYEKALEGIVFDSQEDVNRFVEEVSNAWNALLQEFKNQELDGAMRPVNAQQAQKNISSAVQAYVESKDRNKALVGKLKDQKI